MKLISCTKFLHPLCLLGLCSAFLAPAMTAGVTKIKHVMIYHDPDFYAAFPSVITRPDGELLVAFRRAPDRRVFGETSNNHVDPNSYLVLVRSHDDGETWTQDPELIFAHPFGGSQDPCMNQLNDGSLLVSSYGWARVKDEVKEHFDQSLRHDNFVFMGGYLVKSTDGGDTWSDAIIPPAASASVSKNVFGKPAPAYNRGAMVQDKNGRLYWAVAVQTRLSPRLTSTHLMISDDGGLNWRYSAPIASDAEVSFNETALYLAPSGDLIAFMRTADFNDHTVIARSRDGGASFEPWEDSGFQGHPHFALPLPDGRVFLVHGYRHTPYGIRARILNAECTDYETAEESVLRDDGTGGDLGYPWATLTNSGEILVTYYFHDSDGVSHIAGSLLRIDE